MARGLKAKPGEKWPSNMTINLEDSSLNCLQWYNPRLDCRAAPSAARHVEAHWDDNKVALFVVITHKWSYVSILPSSSSAQWVEGLKVRIIVELVACIYIYICRGRCAVLVCLQRSLDWQLQHWLMNQAFGCGGMGVLLPIVPNNDAMLAEGLKGFARISVHFMPS